MQTFSVQKFGDSAELGSSCRTCNRFLAAGQLTFLFRAAFDTLPAAVNLQRWSIQCAYNVIPLDLRDSICLKWLPCCIDSALSVTLIAIILNQVLYSAWQLCSSKFSMIVYLFMRQIADLNNHWTCEIPFQPPFYQVNISQILLFNVLQIFLLLCWN